VALKKHQRIFSQKKNTTFQEEDDHELEKQG